MSTKTIKWKFHKKYKLFIYVWKGNIVFIRKINYFNACFGDISAVLVTPSKGSDYEGISFLQETIKIMTKVHYFQFNYHRITNISKAQLIIYRHSQKFWSSRKYWLTIENLKGSPVMILIAPCKKFILSHGPIFSPLLYRDHKWCSISLPKASWCEFYLCSIATRRQWSQR